MNGKILVIGSLNMDLVVQTKQCPERGETLIGRAFNQIPGGKGANQAVAAGKLGGNVSMIGSCGKDSFGEALLENLKNSRVNTDSIFRVDTSTGIASIIVEEESGDNRIIVVQGANGELTTDLINQVEPEIKNADIILLQLEILLETVIYILKKASSYQAKVILDPAPAADLPCEVYKNIDYLLPNEGELDSLLGDSEGNNTEQKVNKLLELGIGAVLLTRGDKGVAKYSNGEKKTYKTPVVKAVDTTAAGDAFAGAFAYGLSCGWDEDKAIDYAISVASLSVTRLGAQSSIPDKAEVEKFRAQGAIGL